MNIENRYDGIMKDMISLLQQALFRLITDSNSILIIEEIDLDRLKKYFNHFYKGLSNLQQQFHQKSAKFTKNLTKLAHLFSNNITDNKFNLEPTIIKNVQTSQTINKSNPIHTHNSLKIIGQEQEQNQQWQRKRRSGTAQGGRNKSNTLVLQGNQEETSRPKTGISRMNKRYRSLNIKQTPPTFQQIDDNHFHTLNSGDFSYKETSYRKQRKSFYNELEKTHGDFVHQEIVKIPKKKKSLSMHRWSFKINKLF